MSLQVPSTPSSTYLITPDLKIPSIALSILSVYLRHSFIHLANILKDPYCIPSAVLDAKDTMGKQARYGFCSQGVYSQSISKQASN